MSTTSTNPSVFPPPFQLQPTSTPQENASDTSSSSNRRKRKMEGSIVPSAASSDFSSAVKRCIRTRPDSNTCWNCNASLTQICHIISKSDRAFTRLYKEGLITFDFLGLVDNAVTLCPLYHVNFDDISFPASSSYPPISSSLSSTSSTILQKERKPYKRRVNTVPDDAPVRSSMKIIREKTAFCLVELILEGCIIDTSCIITYRATFKIKNRSQDDGRSKALSNRAEHQWRPSGGDFRLWLS